MDVMVEDYIIGSDNSQLELSGEMIVAVMSRKVKIIGCSCNLCNLGSLVSNSDSWFYNCSFVINEFTIFTTITN